MYNVNCILYTENLQDHSIIHYTIYNIQKIE